MVVMGGGGKWWLLSLLVSVGIFAVLYFTVIKPTTDTANDAIRTSMQQSQQQLERAKKHAPTPSARHALSQAEKLTACIQGAGTDTSQIADCQARFTP
jgi:hypothetical protein